MRRTKLYGWIALVLVLVSVPVWAQSEAIVLGTVRGTITLPEGWQQEETSGETELLAAVSPKGTKMTLNVQTGTVSEGQWDLSLYKDTECEKLGESLVKRLKEGGYENVTCHLHKKDPITWLYLTWEREEDGTRHYGAQYYTAVNGQSITIAFAAEEMISEEEARQMEEIVDSMYFAEIKERPAKEESDWDTRIIWISLLIVAGVITYGITKRRGKR